MENRAVTLLQDGIYTCSCGAKAKANSAEEKRFLKRHPALCSRRKEFTKQLAQTCKSVEGDEDFEYED